MFLDMARANLNNAETNPAFSSKDSAISESDLGLSSSGVKSKNRKNSLIPSGASLTFSW
jgi:hypothetical protein